MMDTTLLHKDLTHNVFLFTILFTSFPISVESVT